MAVSLKNCSFAAEIALDTFSIPAFLIYINNHVNFITKVGFLGYRGYSPDHGDNSSTFGLNVDASNISCGGICKF